MSLALFVPALRLTFHPSFMSETLPTLNKVFSFRSQLVQYHESGEGPPMIMLHNGGASHIIWTHQIEHFSRTHRVIAFDLLGFGESGRPAYPFTLGLYVAMIRQFLQQEGIVQPVLMGNCIGAAIALEFAQKYPEMSGPLVLCNLCGGASMMRYFHPYMFPKSGGVHAESRYRWMFSISRLAWVRRKVIARLYGKSGPIKDRIYHSLLNGITHPKQPQSRLMLIYGLESFSKFDDYDPATRPAVPMQFFWGEQNKVLPLHRGEHLKERLRPDEARIYKGAGHLLMVEQYERFNQEVASFLRQPQPVAQV